MGFIDTKISKDEMAAMKGTGDLAKNLGRVPVLNHNGVVIGQSRECAYALYRKLAATTATATATTAHPPTPQAAICRYLAKRFNLMGSNDVEQAQIESIVEHVVDIKAAFRKIVPAGKHGLTDAELVARLDVWFDTPASPPLDNKGERQLRWFLEQVEVLLPGDGYSVGSRPSLADAYLFNLLGEVAEELPPSSGEPFGRLAGVSEVLESFPKVGTVVENFGTSPGMSVYLATRGSVGF